MPSRAAQPPGTALVVRLTMVNARSGAVSSLPISTPAIWWPPRGSPRRLRACRGSLGSVVSDSNVRQRGNQCSLRRPLIGMFVLGTVVAGGWLLREPVLVGAADIWIVSDPVSRADAIVVLGGGLANRAFVAAELWQRGLADKILISQSPEERAVKIGAMPPHRELNREILLRLGVPAGVIEIFGTANKNTKDEAVALREWAERNAASAFII